MFTVVGIGPGNKDLLTIKAASAIEEAKILVGGRKYLESFANTNHELYAICAGNLKEVIKFIKNNSLKQKLVVLVSGDPGIFSFTEMISKNFSGDEYQWIPGISSIQYAFSIIRKPWHNVVTVSLHGRKNGDIISSLKSNNKVCVLGSSKITPKKISKKLCSEKLDGKAYFFENLSLPEERVIETDFGGLSGIEADSNWLLYLEYQ